MSNQYTSLVNSEMYSVVDDDSIVELDAHLGVPIPHGQYNHPEITPSEMELLEDELRSIGANQVAARLEIEKRYLEEDSGHTFRFTALELADIVVSLAVAKTKATYQDKMDASIAMTHFGRILTESTDELMAESLYNKEIPGLKPIEDERSFIDPFAVISSVQQLIFVDAHGDQIYEDDITEVDLVNDVL